MPASRLQLQETGSRAIVWDALAKVDDVRTILEQARTIAVLGAHWEPERPAFYVPDYLHGQGYRILPVNPLARGRTLFGAAVHDRLDELREPIDIVDVFRRSSALAEHEQEILAMRPLPKVVWFQLGIRDDALAQRLRAAGITVIQDRCTLAEHRRLGLGRVGA
jgi:predicted CoA-binding protein